MPMVMPDDQRLVAEALIDKCEVCKAAIYQVLTNAAVMGHPDPWKAAATAIQLIDEAMENVVAIKLERSAAD